MVKLFGRSWTREALTRYAGNIDQIGGVRLGVLDDGKGRGIRTAHFETGSGLTFTVLLDRGMDIGSTRFKGAALAWESSVGPAHPMYFEKDGLSWHRTWGGGLLNGCGTTTAGAPSEDQGEALGASLLFVHDVITNEGLEPAPHMLLYHFNLGFPLVTEGTEFIAPSRKVTPYRADGATALDHTRYVAPIDHFQEQAFRHEMAAGEDGFATVVLANRAFEDNQGLGLYLRYRPDELPHIMQWMLVRAGTYVTALEPHNCPVMNRAKARETGTLPFLAPGETREYHFEVGVLANNRAIETVVAQVRS